MLAFDWIKSLEGTQGVMRHAPRRSGQQQSIVALSRCGWVCIVSILRRASPYRHRIAMVRPPSGNCLPAGVRVHFLVSFD